MHLFFLAINITKKIKMRHIRFNTKGSLLIQEAHLTKNTLLSGFDLLMKANFFQDKDGFFYSAFFHISISMERIMKLALVTHYMLTNNYQAPTIKQLKKDFGHDIKTLYNECLKLMPIYRSPHDAVPTRTSNDEALIELFTEFGMDSRYFNLNEVCEEKRNRSPLYQWLDISRAIYEEYTPDHIRQKSAMSLIYKMDREGPPNVFTANLDEHGHPMTMFDCLHQQLVIKKSAPLVIWRLVDVLQPIHFLLEAMAHKASEYEVQNKIPSMVIPHYEDFFYFLLANKSDIKKRKRWVEIFYS